MIAPDRHPAADRFEAAAWKVPRAGVSISIQVRSSFDRHDASQLAAGLEHVRHARDWDVLILLGDRDHTDAS
jgi:hypothetical protein